VCKVLWGRATLYAVQGALLYKQNTMPTLQLQVLSTTTPPSSCVHVMSGVGALPGASNWQPYHGTRQKTLDRPVEAVSTMHVDIKTSL